MGRSIEEAAAALLEHALKVPGSERLVGDVTAEELALMAAGEVVTCPRCGTAWSVWGNALATLDCRTCNDLRFLNLRRNR